MPQKRPFPRICIALGVPDAGTLLEHARHEAEAGETFLEFRLDYLPDPEQGAKVIGDFLKRHPECIALAHATRRSGGGRTGLPHPGAVAGLRRTLYVCRAVSRARHRSRASERAPAAPSLSH